MSDCQESQYLLIQRIHQGFLPL
ncbi:hypothetical protein Anas_14486 [Armadillidium nasatum]|uniref:Uncharacterized protein n=1 Tax=Armadillidium nasatum TaxID=96803 RepID=A0A5N5TAY5_9CRUS|nr:hypothetical protein Anas_14486 [Armadillidium nasatum]